MTITGKIQKRLCAGAALAMLAAALLMPAQAAGAPHVTPDTTVAEMRANEGIMGSGVNTWDRGDLLPEQPWMYGHWTLRRFIGPTVEDGVVGLNLIIDNYNQGVQVTYPIYTPEEIAADPSLAEVELYYFPATQPGAKYALVLAGNMFERTSVVKEACGAVIAGGVSKKLDYLVAGEKAGSKREKAEKLGIPILSEQEFLDMLRTGE